MPLGVKTISWAVLENMDSIIVCGALGCIIHAQCHVAVCIRYCLSFSQCRAVCSTVRELCSYPVELSGQEYRSIWLLVTKPASMGCMCNGFVIVQFWLLLKMKILQVILFLLCLCRDLLSRRCNIKRREILCAEVVRLRKIYLPCSSHKLRKHIETKS